MSVYAIGMITVTDRARYERYKERFVPILQQYHGRLLAADEHPQVQEGLWPYQKLILLQFEDRGAYERWATSPEYRETAKDRYAGSDGTVILIQGIHASVDND